MGNGDSSASNIPKIGWNWDQANYFDNWHEPIFELLKRYVPEQSTILEVGAGGSHTLGATAGRLRCEAYGIEPDRDGIKKTVEMADLEDAAVRMIRGDGFYLPFADDRFDVVYSLGLVEHFEQSDTNSLIAEHTRVCRPGGTVIIGVPNLLNLPHTLRKAYLGNRYEYAPERSFTPGRLRKMLIAAGLKSVTIDGLNPLWGLGMSPIGWRMVTALKRVGIAKRLDNARSADLRARIGFMTYAIGTK